MTGLDMIENRCKIVMEQSIGRFYPGGMVDINLMQDMVLATPGRKDYNDIGTDRIRKDVMTYLSDNFAWINVCLFVNEEFRACFRDAVLIEKALLQVSRMDYKEFREDMVLASEANDAAAVQAIGVNLANYNQQVEMMMGMLLSNGHTKFAQMGMTEPYDELLATLSRQEKAEVLEIMYNLLYFVNAMNYNGVFRKYVSIVVENVKKQLA